MKLFDSELKVMDVLWREGDKPAKLIAAQLKDEVGWSKTTTYTIIQKCIEKGAITRDKPGFICQAVITRTQVQETETASLINRMYDGSADKLVASLLGNTRLSADEIDKLRDYVQKNLSQS